MAAQLIRWLIFLHILSALTFFMAHGTSAAMAFKVRRETDFARIRAMATDPFEDAGIYIGTSTGQLFYSRDSGDSWELMADFLPPIQSVEAAVIEE